METKLCRKESDRQAYLLSRLEHPKFLKPQNHHSRTILASRRNKNLYDPLGCKNIVDRKLSVSKNRETYAASKFDRQCFKSRKHIQKQSPRGVLSKRCSENMRQIYRRTLMPKCDFNKFAKQLYWNHTLALVFTCRFAAYFPNRFF